MSEINRPTTATSPLAPALHALEDSAALDPAVQAAGALAGALTASPAVKDALQGAALGHALHPFVVELPMGTWISTTLLDVLGGESAHDGATTLATIGVVTAVPAALTGWAEFADAGPRSKRVAVVHAAANVVGLGLQVASVAARRGGNHRLGATLGMTALGAVGVAGYLGGHLAAARKVGSHDPSFGPETA